LEIWLIFTIYRYPNIKFYQNQHEYFSKDKLVLNEKGLPKMPNTETNLVNTTHSDHQFYISLNPFSQSTYVSHVFVQSHNQTTHVSQTARNLKCTH